MKIALPNEQAVIQDTLRILNQTMAPSQVVILISRWWSDGNDYLKQRDELFADETVDSLVQKIRAFEQVANDDAHRQNTIIEGIGKGKTYRDTEITFKSDRSVPPLTCPSTG